MEKALTKNGKTLVSTGQKIRFHEPEWRIRFENYISNSREKKISLAEMSKK